jgi:hypothetical protein
MTQFIDSIATHQFLPPHQSVGGVTIHGALIDIDVNSIQNYCDMFFNIDDGPDVDFYYGPLKKAPLGLICVTEYPSICSTRPNDWLGGAPQSDHLAQNDICAVIPVLRYRRSRSNVLSEPVVEWIQPLIVIDNSTSTFSGREVLGLEAIHGDFDVVSGTKAPDGTPTPATDPKSRFNANISVRSWRTFQPDSAQEMLPFLNVAFGPALKDLDPTLLEPLFALNEAITLPSGSDPSTREIQLVVLKQYREAGDPLKAIYQAIVATKMVYSKIDLALAGAYHASDVSIEYTPSAMMNQIIGRFLDQKALLDKPQLDETGSAGPVKLSVRLGFSVKCDVKMTDLETRHVFR